MSAKLYGGRYVQIDISDKSYDVITKSRILRVDTKAHNTKTYL